MREQASRAGEQGDRLYHRCGKIEIEKHGGDWHGDVHYQRLAPHFGDRVADQPRHGAMPAGDPPFGGEREDALGARVDRLVDRMAESRCLRSGLAYGAHEVERDPARLAAGGHLRIRLDQQAAAEFRRAEDDGSGAEDAGRDRALQRIGIGGQRHSRGQNRRHEAVLGDRDQQKVQEESLFLGRFSAGQEQIEIAGEGKTAHQVASQVAAANLDAVRVSLAYMRDCRARFPDLHSVPSDRRLARRFDHAIE